MIQLLAHPTPLPCLSFLVILCVAGELTDERRGGDGGGAKSYDREKA
jgi:hypothetical protein